MSAERYPGPTNAGWSSKIPVLAYVVTIRDAARPDKDGLLQPLLRRWQAGGCSYSVFALPAVQVGCWGGRGRAWVWDTAKASMHLQILESLVTGSMQTMRPILSHSALHNVFSCRL